MKDLKVIIIEDELGAANNLKLLLSEVAPHVQVLEQLTSIEDSVSWIEQQPAPDLAFFDIQLEDGLSFDIFKRTKVDFPVIFTTAFDQYAIQAFKVNSVDYLLKPIQEAELIFSLNQFDKIQQASVSHEVIDSILSKLGGQGTRSFLVHYRDRLIPVQAADIGYFYIEESLVHGVSLKGEVYPIEHSLDELEDTLDPLSFFRANRQFIVNREAIKHIEFYFNGRLSLNFTIPPQSLVLISKARVPVFKAWMKNVPGY